VLAEVLPQLRVDVRELHVNQTLYFSLFEIFFLITEVTKFNPKRTGGLRAHWKRDNECERQGDGASVAVSLG
jgi:hypothetical protein